MLNEVAPARLFDELCKLFLQGSAEQAWSLVRDLDLAETLFPDVELTDHIDELIVCAMRGTDERIRDGKPVTPGFLFAVLLWDTYLDRLSRHTEFSSLVEARDSASLEVLREQSEISSIPRRFSQFVREVWLLQPRLEEREPRTLGRVVGHPRFRAAYDFLLLRAATGEVDESLADWWTAYQDVEGDEQATMRGTLDPGKSRKRRRRRRRRPEGGQENQEVDGNRL
jgi:poly(A) polymerase